MDFLRSYSNVILSCSDSNPPRSSFLLFVISTTKDPISNQPSYKQVRILQNCGVRFISLINIKIQKLKTFSNLILSSYLTKFIKKKNSFKRLVNLKRDSNMKMLKLCGLRGKRITTFLLMDLQCSLIKLGVQLKIRKNLTCLINKKWLPILDVMRSNKKLLIKQLNHFASLK